MSLEPHALSSFPNKLRLDEMSNRPSRTSVSLANVLVPGAESNADPRRQPCQ